MRKKIFSPSWSCKYLETSTNPWGPLLRTDVMIARWIARSDWSSLPLAMRLSTMDSARLLIGDEPGLDRTAFQFGPVCVMKPPYNTGTSPQYISDDLPLPE